MGAEKIEFEQAVNLLCKEYAEKYLDVVKYKEFNNQFVYSKKDITKAGANNITFKDLILKYLIEEIEKENNAL